jgi:hypothetical protein
MMERTGTNFALAQICNKMPPSYSGEENSLRL